MIITVMRFDWEAEARRAQSMWGIDSLLPLCRDEEGGLAPVVMFGAATGEGHHGVFEPLILRVSQEYRRGSMGEEGQAPIRQPHRALLPPYAE